MLINSVFGLLVPASAHWGYWWLMTIRFIQGLGEVSNVSEILLPFYQHDSLIETQEERAKMRMCDVSGSVIYCLHTYFCYLQTEASFISL